MGTKNRTLVLSKEKQIFEQIQQTLSDQNSIDECEWKETLIAGLAMIRQSKPEIIFLDEELCFPDVATAVKEFAVKLPGVQIILLAQMGKRDKIDAAILSGAAGYLLKPIDNSEIVTMVRKVLDNSHPIEAVQSFQVSQPKTGEVITMFSTVDSVGKTTIAINIAILLAQLSGEKVCLVDADLQFGDVCRFLNIDPLVTIADFAVEGADMGHPISEFLTDWKGIVDILAAPRELEQSHLVTPMIMNAAIKELSYKYKYIVVDSVVGFTDVGIEIFDNSNLLLFVNTLESIASVKNLRLGIDTLKELGYTQHKMQLILNRYKAKIAIGVAEVENAIKSRFAIRIDNDFNTTSGALQAREPLVLYKPDMNISQDILGLAKKIITGTITEEVKNISVADRFSKWLRNKTPSLS